MISYFISSLFIVIGAKPPPSDLTGSVGTLSKLLLSANKTLKPVKTSTAERSKSTSRSQSMTRERSRRPFTPVVKDFVYAGHYLPPPPSLSPHHRLGFPSVARKHSICLILTVIYHLNQTWENDPNHLQVFSRGTLHGSLKLIFHHPPL